MDSNLGQAHHHSNNQGLEYLHSNSPGQQALHSNNNQGHRHLEYSLLLLLVLEDRDQD